MLKRLLNIIVICLCAVTSFSQADKELNSYVKSFKHFTAASSHKDHGLKYYLKFLRNGDANDFFFKGFRSEACENIASIYESQKQYLKAIAYYDSADTKYRDLSIFCGIGARIVDFHRRSKISHCYVALNEPRKALATWTPFVLGLDGAYVDSATVSDYINLLQQCYTKEQIRKELADGIANMKYCYHYEPLNSTDKLLMISCKISVFDCEIEEASSGSFIKSEEEAKEKLSYLTKELFISNFKELPAYQKIQEL